MPLQAIAGFLAVLGILVVLPENLPAVVDSPVSGATALVITALTNPFYGILAGQAVALLLATGLGASIT